MLEQAAEEARQKATDKASELEQEKLHLQAGVSGF